LFKFTITFKFNLKFSCTKRKQKGTETMLLKFKRMKFESKMTVNSEIDNFVEFI
jgi:hypothetical protein